MRCQGISATTRPIDPASFSAGIMMDIWDINFRAYTAAGKHRSGSSNEHS
jgi:hypothetical protein